MKELLILLSLLSAQSIFGQLSLPEFGIKRHGNTIEQPFHSAFNIHQDVHQQLVAYQSIANRELLVYDGYQFTLKPTSEFEGKQLLQDENGIWVSEENFHLVCHGTKTDSLDVRDYLTRNICELKCYDGIYYLTTNDGLIRFTWSDGKIQVISSHQYHTERLEGFHKSNDTLYFHTGHSLHYATLSDLDHFTEYHIEGLEHGTLFVLPGHRIVHKEIGSYYDKLISLDNSIVDFIVDKKDRLWTYQRNVDRHGVILYKSPSDDGQKLSLGIEDGTYCNFYEDNLGDIWIGTTGEGLLQIYEKSIHKIGKEFGTTSDNIWSINEDRNGRVYLSEGCSGYEVYEKAKIRREQGCLAAIFNDSKDRTWVSTVGVKMVESDGTAHYYGKAEGLYSRTPHAIFEDSHHNIWITTRRALHKFIDGKFQPYIIEETETYDQLFNIVELSPGKLLIAISNGSFYTFENGNFTLVQQDIPEPIHMIKDSDGQIWLATEKDGLYTFREGQFQKLNGENIPARINFIIDSDEGLMWGLCPDNTVFYCEISDLLGTNTNYPVNTLTLDDGLPLINSNTRLQPSTCKLRDGSIIFPNIYGGILIKPKLVTKNKKPYKLLVTQVGELETNPEKIILPYGQRNLQLHVKGVYLNPEKTIITQYRINDGEWTSVEENSKVLIDNLPPGNHTITFRSKHINSEWLPYQRMTVYTQPFIYEQWWFAILSFLLISLIIYIIIKSRTAIIRAQNKLLEETVQEQTKMLEVEKNQLAASLSTQRDLTKKLNLAQASKNRMYAHISHEFRSPLQAISVYLENSNRQLDDHDKKRISKNINYLLNISNEILELSKAETGELRLRPDYYNINSVIREQIELKQPLAEDKNIQLIFESTHPYYLFIDLSMIQKVLANLLSNAIKFSPAGSTVTVKSTRKDKDYCIAVQDNGVGIPQDEVDSLTSDYYQASNNLEQGTGIGLSLAERILQLHGSQLYIESALGEGSTFAFKLPVPEESQAEIIKQIVDDVDVEEQIKSFINPTKKVILAVDDNTDVLYYIKKTLEAEYNVLVCKSAKVALQHLAKAAPAMIISDVNMPIMNGFDFIKAVRLKSTFETIPFLFLTGSISEETEILSIKSGADFILQKPINHELLINQVRQILTRHTKVLEAGKTAASNNLLPRDISNDDLLLMKEIEAIMLEHIDNSKLKSADIASAINMGEKTLRNRVKSITGYTIKEYLKSYRLEKAILLIEQGYGTKGEVAAAVGFSSLSYFSQSLKNYLATKD